MESIEVSLRSYHESSAGMLSETSSWTIDLSNMRRLTQELISKYIVEEMVCRSLVKGGIKHKSQGYQLLNEQYMKKVVTKRNISKAEKMCFLVKSSAAASMKKIVRSFLPGYRRIFTWEMFIQIWNLLSLQTLCCAFISAV